MAVPPNASLPAKLRQSVNAAAVDFYKDVDWALDISSAEFSDADFYYLPGHVIRRDPATQLLIRRDALRGVDVASLPTFAQIAVRRFESSPFDSIVAVAPKRSRNFLAHLADLEFLKAEGLAE